MKVFNNIKDLSKELKVEEWKCERDLEKFMGHGYAIIEGTEIKVAVKNNEFNYIVLDLESNEECKKYFMEYENNPDCFCERCGYKKKYPWEDFSKLICPKCEKYLESEMNTIPWRR